LHVFRSKNPIERRVGIMRKLVRGGVIPVILGLCMVFVIAQSRPVKTLSIATDSQKAEEPIQEPINTNTNTQQESDKDKLIKTTAMVRASKSSSRGSFTATAYCLKGRTATGGSVRRGIVAADRRILKLGSSILLGAGSYSGQYRVTDTGGAIRGKRIDIWVPSCSEARRFGRRTVQVSLVD
jgi:3D (Asp-Asp-Asp) domain-containing protein